MIQTASPNQEREKVFDLIRGVAILGVVYIHGSDLLMPGQTPWLDASYFRWGVPLFLLLSALFSIRSLRAKPVPAFKYLGRRYRKLLLPFLVYSLLYFVLLADWSSLSPSSVITKHFSGYGWPGQYFFILLFQLVLFYPLFSRVNLTKNAFLLAMVLSFLFFPIFAFLIAHNGILDKISYRVFIYWIPYMIAGAYLAQNEDVFRSLPQKYPAVISAVLCILMPFSISLERTFFANSKDQFYVLDSVLATTLILIFFAPSWLSHWKGKASEIISLLGRYSLGVFCLNPLVIVCTRWLLNQLQISLILNPLFNLIISFISVVYVSVVCMALIKLIEKLKGDALIY